ncbi:hypothetical protein [Cryobacterium sp. PAMC25264]|uniref:hypothetical protein n=1 Tax=Cryobacterium sp. PAMC25264 TaxID=2861288 RepID=UPI001C639D94|nr:hypothetical protein [Cryobacterium sp. PAMC25264]QYF72883.1 hypothetical protein KY500_14025 [Cryobacterium sp. PAMC25264]
MSSADQHGDAESLQAGNVSPAAETPSVPAGPAATPVPVEPTETVVSEETLVVRRSPRYISFMIVGAVAGAVLALLLTVIFPQNAEFDPAQVFGFLLLAGVAVGVALSCLVAIVLERFVGRSVTTVVADRLDANLTHAFEKADPGSDPQPSNENS